MCATLAAALIIPGGGVVIVLLAQVGLFAVMTWYNRLSKAQEVVVTQEDCCRLQPA